MAPRGYNPCSYLPRRLQIVTSLALFLVFIIVFFGSSASDDVPYKSEMSGRVQKAADYIQRDMSGFSKPSWWNPFTGPAHEPPPEQANSTSGDAKWFSDWKWQNPFSSSITLDENRAVLPPLKPRTPVYTYYDSAATKDQDMKEAEHELLVTWRRAWWAKGFRPVVLGSPDAINNPLYRRALDLDLEPELKSEVMRWLAWGNMGTGILANWLAYPMADYDDSMMISLRHGEFPQLTRYEGLGNGMFAGEKEAINKAIEAALSAKQPIKASSMADLVPKDTFHVDPEHDSIAFYSTEVILRKYKNVAEKLQSKSADIRAEGMSLLPQLITSHLHTTWQNTFTSGISVLKPLPDQMTTVVFTASELARNLSQCPESPSPASCPPNIERCKACVSKHPMVISYAPVFRNISNQFTIGTIPHAYTLNSLLHPGEQLSTRFIRRKTDRDLWIVDATRELLGTGLSSYARLRGMKDAVASPFGQSHSLWMTAERDYDADWHEDLAWVFGFPVPQEAADTGKSETPVPGPERRPPPPKPEGKIPDKKELKREEVSIQKARELLKTRSTKAERQVRAAVEAWNLADTELWRFVRAFAARRRVERQKWEEEERRFAGSEAKGSWGRWLDKGNDDDTRM